MAPIVTLKFIQGLKRKDPDPDKDRDRMTI